jgi:hypothetical protein
MKQIINEESYESDIALAQIKSDGQFLLNKFIYWTNICRVALSFLTPRLYRLLFL